MAGLRGARVGILRRQLDVPRYGCCSTRRVPVAVRRRSTPHPPLVLAKSKQAPVGTRTPCRAGTPPMRLLRRDVGVGEGARGRVQPAGTELHQAVAVAGSGGSTRRDAPRPWRPTSLPRRFGGRGKWQEPSRGRLHPSRVVHCCVGGAPESGASGWVLLPAARQFLYPLYCHKQQVSSHRLQVVVHVRAPARRCGAPGMAGAVARLSGSHRTRCPSSYISVDVDVAVHGEQLLEFCTCARRAESGPVHVSQPEACVSRDTARGSRIAWKLWGRSALGGLSTGGTELQGSVSLWSRHLVRGQEVAGTGSVGTM